MVMQWLNNSHSIVIELVAEIAEIAEIEELEEFQVAKRCRSAEFESFQYC